MLTANVDFERIKMPGGEVLFRVTQAGKYSSIWSHVTFEYERNEEIFELLLLTDALRGAGWLLNSISIPYIPYSRQDRRTQEGESFSLKVFASILNSIGFKEVYTNDPHSDMCAALIDNLIIEPQHAIFKDRISPDAYLISPDAGALKKIYKLASSAKNAGVVECSKQRDTVTGQITGTRIHGPDDFNLKECFIVDDICDGGATFTAIAKELRKRNAGPITLCVTHGFFTRGLEPFEGLIDNIYTRKGKIK